MQEWKSKQLLGTFTLAVGVPKGRLGGLASWNGPMAAASGMIPSSWDPVDVQAFGCTRMRWCDVSACTFNTLKPSLWPCSGTCQGTRPGFLPCWDLTLTCVLTIKCTMGQI